MPIPMISGLFLYARGGIVRPPSVTQKEIPQSLGVNPRYRHDLIVLAGDRESARRLKSSRDCSRVLRRSRLCAYGHPGTLGMPAEHDQLSGRVASRC